MYDRWREKYGQAESPKANLCAYDVECCLDSRGRVFVNSGRTFFFSNHSRYERGLGSVFPENGARRKEEIISSPTSFARGFFRIVVRGGRFTGFKDGKSRSRPSSILSGLNRLMIQRYAVSRQVNSWFVR